MKKVMRLLKVNHGLAVATLMINLLVLLMGTVGCDESEENHHRYPDHGESRWNDNSGQYEYYNAYQEIWVPADKLKYYQLEGWGQQGDVYDLYPVSDGGNYQSNGQTGSGVTTGSGNAIMFQNDTTHDWQVEVGGTTYTVSAGSPRNVTVSGPTTVRYMVNGFWTGPSGSSTAGSTYRLHMGGGYEIVN
jgi:hypothetical protein